MASKVQTEVISHDNITTLNAGRIYIAQKADASSYSYQLNTWSWYNVPYVKYQIKETDMRRKTANFTTSHQLDLTDGLYFVKIVTPLHENFVGVFLAKDHTINSDGTYTYQCQDMSRLYQSKYELICSGDVTLYRILLTLLSNMALPLKGSFTAAQKKQWKPIVSGLRPLDLYKPSLFGNPISTNMLAQKPKLIIRDVSVMDAILDICHTNGYVDVYFSNNGVLQIEPISTEEWSNTGLVLTNHEVAGSANLKFDTKNIVTVVNVESTSKTKVGTLYEDKQLVTLDLSAFFGNIVASIDNPLTNTTTTKKSAAKATAENGNPYGTKKKYLLIDADGGTSRSFMESVASYIRKGGWTVETAGIGPGEHSRNKGKVKNGCYMPIYNGLCAGTINEMPLSYYGGVIKKNGSVLCPAWDTSDWTSSRMKQYRTDISKISWLKRAWDDNFSPAGFSGISNPAKFMTNHGIKYCVGNTPKLIADQFLAGGWEKYYKK